MQASAQNIKLSMSRIMADLDKAIELSPRFAMAYYNKGNLLLEGRDYTSALSAYNKAIEHKPDLGEAYYNRGYVIFRLGNKRPARRPQQSGRTRHTAELQPAQTYG